MKLFIASKDWFGLFVLSIILAISIHACLLLFNAPLQKIALDRTLLKTEQFWFWSVLQVIPVMYSFGHHVIIKSVELGDPQAEEKEKLEEVSWDFYTGHFPTSNVHYSRMRPRYFRDLKKEYILETDSKYGRTEIRRKIKIRLKNCDTLKKSKICYTLQNS